jgi:hypothetical protein
VAKYDAAHQKLRKEAKKNEEFIAQLSFEIESLR